RREDVEKDSRRRGGTARVGGGGGGGGRTHATVGAGVREGGWRGDLHVADDDRPPFNPCAGPAGGRAGHRPPRPAVDTGEADAGRTPVRGVHSATHQFVGQVSDLVSPHVPSFAYPSDLCWRHPDEPHIQQERKIADSGCIGVEGASWFSEGLENRA